MFYSLLNRFPRNSLTFSLALDSRFLSWAWDFRFHFETRLDWQGFVLAGAFYANPAMAWASFEYIWSLWWGKDSSSLASGVTRPSKYLDLLLPVCLCGEAVGTCWMGVCLRKLLMKELLRVVRIALVLVIGFWCSLLWFLQMFRSFETIKPWQFD